MNEKKVLNQIAIIVADKLLFNYFFLQMQNVFLFTY